MKKHPLFGVAGNPPNFWKSKFSKSRVNSPFWLKSVGLDALEVQCGYGVRMKDEDAIALYNNSKECNIELSIHGPYYISLGSNDPEKVNRSLNELFKSCKLAKKIGAKKIVFHLGSIYGNRDLARKNAIKTLKIFESEWFEDFNDILLLPEVAGKINQFGSLEDIIEICKNLKHTLPCIDFAHLHARNHGSLKKKSDFENVLKILLDTFYDKFANNFHVHLYPVEFGNGGEVTHKAFSDNILYNEQFVLFEDTDIFDKRYYPRYEPFINTIIELNLSPTIICEAKDTQDIGALEMKVFYKKILEFNDV